MNKKNKQKKCRIGAFFTLCNRFAPVYQRIAFECIAKAARENPALRSYELLDAVVGEINAVDALMKG
jgi:hypothetical protein